MSTRIYNGYRIPAARPATVVAREFAAAVRPAYREATIKALTVTSLLLLTQTLKDAGDPDPAAVHDDPEPASALVSLSYGMCTAADIPTSGSVLHRAGDYLALLRKRSRDTSRRHRLDRDVSVTFVADPTDPAWMYALLYTEHDAYRHVWESMPGVEPYAYWNNTDRPDDITEDEWEARREAWDRAIGREAPAAVGVSWELDDNVDIDVIVDDDLKAEVVQSIWSVLTPAGRARYSDDPAVLRQALTSQPR